MELEVITGINTSELKKEFKAFAKNKEIASHSIAVMNNSYIMSIIYKEVDNGEKPTRPSRKGGDTRAVKPQRKPRKNGTKSD